MRSLSPERGRSIVCLRLCSPLRMRDRKSAIGSVIDIWTSSPARLDDARQLTLERQIAEAEPAHIELAHVGARTAAQGTPALGPDVELVLLRKHLAKLAHACAPCAAVPSAPAA